LTQREPPPILGSMIDIFNHFMPKAYLDRLGDFIPGHPVLTAFPRLRTLWDVDARRAATCRMCFRWPIHRPS
jgi:hypothetical protein